MNNVANEPEHMNVVEHTHNAVQRVLKCLINIFLLYLRVLMAYKSSKYTIYVYKKWRAMLARHKSSSVYSHAHLSKHTYTILPPIAIRRKAGRSLD
jgi:hypothetical protein